MVELLRFLAIGRPNLSPKTKSGPHEVISTLLSHVNDENYSKYNDLTARLLKKSPKMIRDKRLRLTSEDYDVHVQMDVNSNDDTLLFIAIADKSFSAYYDVSTFFNDWLYEFIQVVPRSEWDQPATTIQSKSLPVLQHIFSSFNYPPQLKSNPTDHDDDLNNNTNQHGDAILPITNGHLDSESALGTEDSSKYHQSDHDDGDKISSSFAGNAISAISLHLQNNDYEETLPTSDDGVEQGDHDGNGITRRFPIRLRYVLLRLKLILPILIAVTLFVIGFIFLFFILRKKGSNSSSSDSNDN